MSPRTLSSVATPVTVAAGISTEALRPVALWLRVTLPGVKLSNLSPTVGAVAVPATSIAEPVVAVTLATLDSAAFLAASAAAAAAAPSVAE